MGMMMTICGSKYSDTGLALPVHIAIIYVFTATVKCRDHADGYGYDDDYDDEVGEMHLENVICKAPFSPQYVKICHWSR